MNKVQRHKEICDYLNDLYAKKNHDYGDSFHHTFVEEGLAMSRIRLGDKFSRFKTLSRGDASQVRDESIEDTLLDLANYAIMTVLELREGKGEESPERNELDGQLSVDDLMNAKAPQYTTSRISQ